jgi:hypothetical protein
MCSEHAEATFSETPPLSRTRRCPVRSPGGATNCVRSEENGKRTTQIGF